MNHSSLRRRRFQARLTDLLLLGGMTVLLSAAPASCSRSEQWLQWRLPAIVRADRHHQPPDLHSMQAEGSRMFFAAKVSLQRLHVLTCSSCWPLSLGLLASLLLSPLVGATLSQHVARPLRDLIRGVEALRRGDPSVCVEIRSRDELEELANSLQTLVEGMRERDQLREALVRHLSASVVQKILAPSGVVHLGGEYVTATIMFADFRGFTSQCQGMSPMAAVNTLNEYFSLIVDVILQYQGTLDKFLGDGLMVVFGAPVAQADHAQRALRCALHIQGVLEHLNRRRTAEGKVHLQLGIGLHSGQVVAGQIGSQRRLEYTVIGSEVNRAFRIQSLAGPGEVLVSEQCYALAGDMALPAESLGPTPLRGFREPLVLYRIQHRLARAA
ncbi:MAG: adenylate/guanylate cyclase domain-containing protein [candidate division WS1 bacterium]|nr:adenylate/guanylate cyclase domain-containing protein [candidate division WS1 bacterium]